MRDREGFDRAARTAGIPERDLDEAWREVDALRRMTRETERELVAAMILERPLCATCLAERTHLDRPAVDDALAGLAEAKPLHVAVEYCAGCRTVQTTYRLSRGA